MSWQDYCTMVTSIDSTLDPRRFGVLPWQLFWTYREACGLDGPHRLHPCRLGRRAAHRGGFGTLFGGRPRAAAHHRELQRPTDQPNRHPRLVGNPQCGAPDVVKHVRLERSPPRLRSPLDAVGHPENKPPGRGACSCGRSRVATADPGPWMGVATARAHVVHAAKSRGVELLGQPDRAPHVAEVLRNQPHCGVCMGERMARRRHPDLAPERSIDARARHVVPFQNLAS